MLLRAARHTPLFSASCRRHCQLLFFAHATWHTRALRHDALRYVDTAIFYATLSALLLYSHAALIAVFAMLPPLRSHHIYGEDMLLCRR